MGAKQGKEEEKQFSSLDQIHASVSDDNLSINSPGASSPRDEATSPPSTSRVASQSSQSTTSHDIAAPSGGRPNASSSNEPPAMANSDVGRDATKFERKQSLGAGVKRSAMGLSGSVGGYGRSSFYASGAPAGSEEIGGYGLAGIWEEIAVAQAGSLDEVQSPTTSNSEKSDDDDDDELSHIVFVSSRDVVLIHLQPESSRITVSPLCKGDYGTIVDSHWRPLIVETRQAGKVLQWNGRIFAHCTTDKKAASKRETMFWWLVKSGQPQPMAAFLELGNFRKLPDLGKLTGPQLHELVRTGDPPQIIQQLKKVGMDCTYRGIGGYTALHIACKRGLVEVLDALVTNQADPNAQDRHGRTPIWYAAEGGHTPVVEWMMSGNIANHLIADYQNVSPLMAAMRRGKEETEKLLKKTIHHSTPTEIGEVLDLFDGPIYSDGPIQHINCGDSWQLTHRLLDGYDAPAGVFRFKATRAQKIWQLIAKPLLVSLSSGNELPKEEADLAKYILENPAFIGSISQDAHADTANADAELSAARSAALAHERDAVKQLGVSADTVDFRLHGALDWEGEVIHQVHAIGLASLDFLVEKGPREIAQDLWQMRVLTNLQDFSKLAHDELLEESASRPDAGGDCRIDCGKSTKRFRSAALSMILIADARRVSDELRLRLKATFGSRAEVNEIQDGYAMRYMKTQRSRHAASTETQFSEFYPDWDCLTAGGVCDVIHAKLVFNHGADLREAAQIMTSWELKKDRMEVIHVVNALHPTAAVQGHADIGCEINVKLLLQVSGSERRHIADVRLVLKDLTHFREYALFLQPILSKGVGDGGQEVRALGAALKDLMPVKRKEAAEALGKMGARGARYVAEIAVLLKDADADVRCAAAEAVGLFRDAGSGYADEVALLLQDKHGKARLAAITALGRLGDAGELHGAAGAAQAESIASCLKDSDATVRCAAAQALGRLGAAAIPHVEALGKALFIGCAETQAAAVQALGRIGPAGVQHCANMLNNPDPAVQCVAASALAQMGKPGASYAGQVASVLRSSTSATVRRASVEALGQMGNAGVQHVQEIACLLGDEDVQAEATKALLQLGREGTAQAAALLKDSSQPAHVRSAAVATLGKMGDVATPHIEEVAACLIEPDIGVRIAACKALAELGDMGACHAADVAALLRKRYPNVRLAAARSLEMMGRRWRQHVIAEVLPLLHDEKVGIRCAVVEALGHMGDIGISCVSDLGTLLGHEDDNLRRAATKSLALMGDAGAGEAAALLRDSGSDLRVQKAAAEVLAAMGDTGARHAAALLEASEWEVQRSAAEALGSMGEDTNRKAVHAASLLKTGNPDVQCRAMLTLSRLGDAGARHSTAVSLLLRDSNASVRRAAAEVIGLFGQRGARHAASLSVLLHDPEESVQCMVCESLGMLGQTGAYQVSRIIKLLDGKTEKVTVRCAAIKCLSSLAHLCSGSRLAERPGSALGSYPGRSSSRMSSDSGNRRSPSPHAGARGERPESRLSNDSGKRSHGSHFFGIVEERPDSPRPESALESDSDKRSGKPEGIEELTPEQLSILSKIFELLNDPESTIRASAADALGRMTANGVTTPEDQEAHAEAIGALLTDGAPGVRRAAIEALGVVAPPGPWLNDVQFLLEDPHIGVRRAADHVISKLQKDDTVIEDELEDDGELEEVEDEQENDESASQGEGSEGSSEGFDYGEEEQLEAGRRLSMLRQQEQQRQRRRSEEEKQGENQLTSQIGMGLGF